MKDSALSYSVRKWGVRDWRVMEKPFYSLTARTVSQHTTKSAALADLRRIVERPKYPAVSVGQ